MPPTNSASPSSAPWTASTSPASPPPPGGPAAPLPEAPIDAREIADGKVLAALGYPIGIIALIVLIMRNNAFALYHAKQTLTLFIFAIGSALPLGALFCIIGMVFPRGAGCVVLPIWGLFGLACMAMVVLGIVNAASGKVVPLPVIGPFGIKWFAGIRKAPTPAA